MATPKIKLSLSVIVVIALLAVGYVVWHRAANKPVCNCIYQQTREYGVIQNDECIPMDCKTKSK